MQGMLLLNNKGIGIECFFSLTTILTEENRQDGPSIGIPQTGPDLCNQNFVQVISLLLMTLWESTWICSFSVCR